MKTSAGILLYRIKNNQIEILLGHMGGPFYTKKDIAAWDIPKGEFEGEDALSAAHREFEEEIGQPASAGEAIELGEVKTSNKVVMIWAIEGDLDVSKVKSNTFQIEWPPKSGQLQEFPEVDKAAWLNLETAKIKIVKSRIAFLERLAEMLKDLVPGIQINSASKPPQQSLF